MSKHARRGLIGIGALSLVGCSADSVAPPPQFAVETVSVVASVPASTLQSVEDYPYASVAMDIRGESSVGKSTSVVCSIDGIVAQCSGPSKQLPGTHSWCAVAASASGMVSRETCGQFTIVKLEKSGKVLVIDSGGRFSYPAGIKIFFGPEAGARDTVITAIGGTFTIASKYVGMKERTN